MKVRNFLTLVFICIITNSLFAQKASDYRKAAEQGNAVAQCNLGVCYRNGWGVTQDYKQAVYWYKKAAEQGDAAAQYNLGVCYKNGWGVTQDYKQAVYWYKKAAEQGNAATQYNLGVCYDNGWGVTQDYKQAVYWYKKAAEQGNANAQYNLGVCYYNGEGVDSVDRYNAQLMFNKHISNWNNEKNKAWTYYKADSLRNNCYTRLSYEYLNWKKDTVKAEQWFNKIDSTKINNSFLKDIFNLVLSPEFKKIREEREYKAYLKKKRLEEERIQRQKEYERYLRNKPFSNDVGSVSINYVQKRLVSKDGKDFYNSYFDKGRAMHGFSIAASIIRKQTQHRFAIGIDWQAAIDMYFAGKRDAEEDDLSTYIELAMYMPIDLTLRLRYSNNQAIGIIGGLGVDFSIWNSFFKDKSYYTTDYWGNSYYHEDNRSRSNNYGNGLPERLNLSYEVGCYWQYKYFIINAKYQKGFFNIPYDKHWDFTQDKLLIGFSFLF